MQPPTEINEEIKCVFPAQGIITLRLPKREVIKYLFLLFMNTCEEDIDSAINILSHTAPSVELQRVANVVATICQFTRDGFIEPKEFNVFETYEKVCEYLKEKGFCG